MSAVSARVLDAAIEWQLCLDSGSVSAEQQHAFAAWLAAHPERVPDALGLKVAMDEAQRKPACQACRTRLKALLWPVLPAPLAAPVPRPATDGPARSYRELLRRERER